jgi:hypothetical protein
MVFELNLKPLLQRFKSAIEAFCTPQVVAATLNAFAAIVNLAREALHWRK